MAFSAAANSGYAPGSIAAQPRRFAGGVRKRGESPDQMANRMDAGYMASAMQGLTTGSTRAEKIAASRADGTFDAKRNAFNAANKGSFMDAAGNIGPKAEMPTTPTPSPASSPPAPAPASAPTTTASAPMKPRGPASFDGKPKAGFFGAAMAKYGPTAGVSAYKDQETKAVAANGGKPIPAPTIPAPAAKPSGVVAAASTPVKPYSGPMARPPGQVDAKPTASVTPTAKPAGIVAAASTKAPANGFSPEFHRRFDPAPSSAPSSTQATTTSTPPATKPAPRLDAAQTQAVKNPQGLSARMNPPGVKPRGIAEDALVGKWWQGEMQKAEDLKKLGSKIAGGFKQQALKNPQGLAAKVTRFFGGDTTPKKQPAGFMAAATMK